MIKRLTFIFLLTCLFPVFLFAQDKAGAISVSPDSVMFSSGFPTTNHTESADHQQKSRYLLRVGMDFLSGSGEATHAIRFYMSHGHRFTPPFSMGIGIGYTAYNDPMSMIPFFVYLNYQLNNNNYSPYVSIKTGYNFAMRPDDNLQLDSYSGGLLLNPSAGIEFSLNRGAGIFINAGYNIDNSSYQYETWGNRTVINYLSFRRLSLGTGFTF